MIRIYAAENYEEMSEKAARIIAAQMIVKPECVLGLATGSSPVGTYQRLVERYKAGKLSFAGVTTVNLDEYKGLSGAHDQSYQYFMQHNLFDHVDVRPECTHVPNGLAGDAGCRCAGSAVNGKMDNWFPTPGIAVKTASAVPAGHSAAAPGMQTGQRRSCFRKPSGRNAPRPPSIFPQTEGYPRQGQCANRAISARSGLQPEKAVEEAGTRQAASLCI